MTEETETKAGRGGCGMTTLLLGGILMGGGVYLMSRWDASGGGGKAGAVILVVLGTLILLPIVLFGALKFAVKFWFGKAMKNLTAAGEQMVAVNKAMYGKLHQFRAARDADFEAVDRAAYDTAREQLAGLGFRFLGDVVDETIEEISGASPVIRIMASTDGTTTAGFFHLKSIQMPRGLEGMKLLVYDLSTEFTDGAFLLTANTQGLDQTTAATGIDRRQHPLDTPVEQLVRAHETEKQKLTAARAEDAAADDEGPVVIIHTLDDALESEKRQQLAKNAFREEIGFVDPEEVRRIAQSGDGDPALGDIAARAAYEASKRRRTDDNRD